MHTLDISAERSGFVFITAPPHPLPLTCSQFVGMQIVTISGYANLQMPPCLFATPHNMEEDPFVSDWVKLEQTPGRLLKFNHSRVLQETQNSSLSLRVLEYLKVEGEKKKKKAAAN